MKQLTLSTLLILFAFCINAQKETHNLSDFTDLYASTSVKVELVPSNQNRAEVEIEKGDPDNFHIDEAGSKLKIYWKNKSGFNWGKKRQANVTLYYNQNLEKIDVSAGAYVFSDDVISVEDLQSNVNSGGSLKIEINADELNADVNSGGNFTVWGKANTLEVDANSGGYFGGKKLEATHVDAHANSGGSANVWATQSIKASANSGGNVSYKGEPTEKKIKKDKWSGGSVSKI